MSHSEIHGLTPACGSPWLIATCYVLHRLLAPRHPPQALSSLITKEMVLKNHHSANCIFLPYNICYLCVDFKERPKLRPPAACAPFGLVRKSLLQTKMVGVTGVEPVTLRLSSACSNQLSYTPARPSARLVELRRVELLTYSLQSYRSTN